MVTEGFSNVEELAYISKEDLSSIEGFDENLAEELINRANVYLDKREEEIKKQLSEKNIDEKIVKLGAFSNSDLLVLANAGIQKLDDVADLSAYELVELLQNLSETEASDVIMKAREHWFK